jgi:hypothetical protein
MTNKTFSILASACALALTGCAGGGGMDSASTMPTPMPTPTPTPTPSANSASWMVNIFPSPKPETYVSVGLVDPSTLPVIRYSAAGYYEIKMPGKDWDRLVFPANVIPQDPATFNYFVGQKGTGSLAISLTRLRGYQYSEIANSLIAFGSATPSGSVPAAGSGAYHGEVDGWTDILQPDLLVGGKVPVSANGSVDLLFNFAAGSLSGSMTLRADAYAGRTDLGTFTFKDTVFSVGNTTYSGAFDSPLAGQNFFRGEFTGPHAEETIGAWSVPFLYSGDGQTHQAAGAFVAKK